MTIGLELSEGESIAPCDWNFPSPMIRVRSPDMRARIDKVVNDAGGSRYNLTELR